MASIVSTLKNVLMTDTGSNKSSSSSSSSSGTKTTTQTSNQAASSSSSSSKSSSGSMGNIKTMDQIKADIDKTKAQVATNAPEFANALQGASSEQAAANRAKVADAFNTLVTNAKNAWNESVNNSSNNGGGNYGGSGSSGGGGVAPTPVNYEIGSDPSLAVRDTDEAAGNVTKGLVDQVKDALGTYNIAPINYVDIEQQRRELAEQKRLQEEQITNQTNYTVSQGINELMRNVEDAKRAFQTQRNQVDTDERRALDNQVLYAEARGDRGGIGQAQYGAVQNTAAVNRLAVNQAETKLQTDTNNQIADLRAQGDFTKADKLLQIAQSYQSQLMNLEMWAKEQNVGVEEFNAGLSEWQAEYQRSVAQLLNDTEMTAANMTGAFSNGQRTYQARQADKELLANAAASLIQHGVAPTIEQLQNLGWTSQQALDYLRGYYPYGIQV